MSSTTMYTCHKDCHKCDNDVPGFFTRTATNVPTTYHGFSECFYHQLLARWRHSCIDCVEGQRMLTSVRHTYMLLPIRILALAQLLTFLLLLLLGAGCQMARLSRCCPRRQRCASCSLGCSRTSDLAAVPAAGWKSCSMHRRPNLPRRGCPLNVRCVACSCEM
jgi:hypothetical protein